MRLRNGVLVLVMLALVPPGEAAADTIIANERAPSKVSAELNRVMWSSYDPATGDYYLMSRDTVGTITRLPVAPRKVPFDVDVGYLGEGAEVATYSRCAKEPSLIGGGSAGVLPNWATGRGCDIYLFDFDAQRETKYAPTAGGHASEFLPTASAAGRIAFARVYEQRRGRRGRLPYLYAKRGSHSLRRLPGGARGRTGLPGPTSLDLSGPRLAFSWDYTPLHRGITASKVAVDEIRGPHRTLESVVGGLTLRSLFSPSIALRDVLWGRTVAIDGDRSEFHYAPGLTRATRSAQAPLYIISTAGLPSRGGIYYEATQNLSVLSKPPPCSAPTGSPPPAGTDPLPPPCVIARTDTLTFTR
jgi:hypothetical protein